MQGMALLIAAAAVLLAVPVSCFHAPNSLLLSSAAGSCGRACAPLRGSALTCMAVSGEERLGRASAVRFLASAMVASIVPYEKTALAAAADDDEEEASDDSQIVDLDEVDGKKLAIVGGAFVFADLLSALLTGRSVIPFPFTKPKDGDWKTKVLDKLLEDEKKKNAEKMGVSITTNSDKGRVSSTGEMAKTDPFEIAKQKYAKKPSVDELRRDLSKKLDTKDDDDDF